MRDIILQVQGACEGTARPRDRGLEESRIVALGYDVLHVLELFNFNICCIRVKFELLNYGWIVGYIHCYEYWFMSPSGCFNHRLLYWTVWTYFMQVLYLGRAPRTKETLLDLLKWRRVTRHPLVFRGLTGSQRTLGFRASQKTNTINIIN